MKLGLEPRAAPSRVMLVAAPGIAVALTLVAGGLMLAAMGRPPIETLGVYFLSPFADAYGRAELVVKAVPLALIGAGLAVALRAGVWNIGAAGQYTLGAIAAGGVALALPGAAAWWGLPLFLVAGILGGMAWGAIPAFLRTRFGASEILVSLMLTYVATLLLDLLVRGPWKDPMGFGFPQTRDFAAAYGMPLLVEGTRLHAGVILAVMVALGLSIVMARLIWGFQVRVIGEAPRAGAFAGFRQDRMVWAALLLSGGLAGLAGAVEISATVRQLQPDISAGYGFAAIIVAFLGRLHPAGALPAALVLAVSYLGGENAQILLALPRSVTGIFQGMLLFFLLAADVLVRHRLVWRG